MESFLGQLSELFGWLLRCSVYAGLLVGLVLIVKAVVRGKLPAKWHYLLWLVVVARMVMPWGPQSRVSVLNVIPDAAKWHAKAFLSAEVLEKDFEAGPVAVGDQGPVAAILDAEPSRSLSFRVTDVLALVWLSGALVLAAYVFASNFRMWRIVKSVRPLTDQRILELLEDCKVEMGVQTILGIVVTDRVKSPALFGFVRPRLLLPEGIIETRSVKELRHIFLHELSHLKRHDIFFGWVTSVLLVIHWFNPLAWYAFYRMRQDRELACDASALSAMETGESEKYGLTIVQLLEKFSRGRALPIIAAVSEDKSNLKRRVKMIAQFRKEAQVWSVLAVVLIVVLSCVTLTDAKQRVLAAATRENLLKVLGQSLSYRRGGDLVDGIDDYVDGPVIHDETIERIDLASAQELAAHKALEEVLESGEYGPLDANDIITAQRRIRATMLCSRRSKVGLDYSTEELEDALKALGINREDTGK
jgi:beta-lactamase regulating signal transducer with metallopeptidase domain